MPLVFAANRIGTTAMAANSIDMLDALDPGASVVVEACAGSGKTWLLVSRIVRLLMAGVAPGEILAITFTRKGAQEMQERLSTWLEELAIHPNDAHVKAFLRERGMPDDAATIARARGLFETALTAQPGIKINTFHGWFADLVQRAPLQAGLAKGFTLTETVHALEQEAWQRYAQSLAMADANPQQNALDELFREVGLHNTRKLLASFLAKRAEWWRFTAGEKEPATFAAEQLMQQCQVNLEADYFVQLFRDASFDDALTRLVAAFESGGKAEQKVFSAFEVAGAILDPSERFAAMKPLIFTKDGDVRDARLKFCAKIGPSATDALMIVGEKMRSAEQHTINQRVVRINRCAFIAGQGLLEHYQALKAERGLLDFTDIEYAAYSLLRHSEHAEYMQYKLDARYRHILLDEFQDTNPLQWMTLQAWLQASSDAGLRPTVFLVGDPKQSIFYFRRADARLFGHATEFLQREYGARVLQQNVSRRSAPAVLDAVNSVFAEAKQLSGFAPHQAFNGKMNGEVYVLPLTALPENVKSLPASSGLRDLLSTPQESETEIRRAMEAAELARGLGTIIGNWTIQDGEKQRPAEYRDVMILTRGRTQLRAYESALRSARIPYTSARKGGLLDSLEAQDLMALLQFLLRPSDNLSLVHALRAPFFACSDEDLIVLAQIRGENWWQRLHSDEQNFSTALARAHACLERWLSLAPQLPVHDLLDRIFHEADVEARYANAVPLSMSKSVQANLTAFMELSLTLDSGRYPSLARFLADLNALRRAPDIEAPDEGTLAEAGDAVRILTVHGAKGLEAPIVWLIDATAKRKPRDGYDVLVTWPTGAERPSHFSFLTTKAEQGKSREIFLAEELAIHEQEEANLLYVAMTRAKQYLIVSGNRVGSGTGSWYEALSQTLQVREIAQSDSVSQAAIVIPIDSDDSISIEEEPLATFPHGTRKSVVVDSNRDYGIKLHSLLETAHDSEISNAIAERILANEENATRENLMRHARSILRAPHLQHFFDPKKFKAASNEVSLVDANGELLRLDRLVEFDDEVWVLDYKSATSQTAQSSALLADYRAQLTCYRGALLEIYPDKLLRCGLIFGDAVLQEVT
jgi:ATP-dependent helicase/nuclease subunit A